MSSLHLWDEGQTAYRSTFDSYLKEMTEQFEAHLESSGWLDNSNRRPKLEVIRSLIEPQNQALPQEVRFVLQNCPTVGAAYEALGKLTVALSWYELGQYIWRGGQHIPSPGLPQMSEQDWAAQRQLPAAVCADRVGSTERARDCYLWAAENYYLPLERERADSYEGDHLIIWERHIYRAYALCCLERWEEALAIAEDAHYWASKDRDSKASPYPLRILPAILSLARYKVEATPEHRRMAQEYLHPQIVASQIHTDHLHLLFYLYNLRAKHPELTQVSSEEAPLPDMIREAADACRAAMMEGGLKLDGTPESLKQLDPVMRELYKRCTNEPEHRKNIFLMCGSYFGEVIREELAGGQWHLSPKGLLDSTLRWEFGEVSYEIWPFGHLRAYLEGQTDKNLSVFWQETEDAFMQCALNARYAD